MKKSYNIDEVAEDLSVSRRTVERAIKNGQLHAFTVNRTRRVDAEELARLKKKEQGATT